MAGIVADRARRSSSAERIEYDLAALWRDVAREGPLSRAVMSNLVVFCRCPANGDGRPPHTRLGIEEVVQRHPARVIVLQYDPVNAAARDRQSPVVQASVEVLTFGPSGSRYGVEQIVIRSSCGDAAIRSIVRRLTLGDIPTTVWWTEDLSLAGPLTPLARMGRQFLYDSRCWADVRAATLAIAPLLSDEFRPDLADRNWRRLAPVRRAVRHALESRNTARFDTGAPLRVRHRPGDAALAWLLAGWAGVSGVMTTATPLDPPIEDTQMTGEVLTASLEDGFALRMTEERVIVEDRAARPPLTMALPRENDTEAVAAELGMLTEDTVFHSVLSALIGHFKRD